MSAQKGTELEETMLGHGWDVPGRESSLGEVKVNKSARLRARCGSVAAGESTQEVLGPSLGRWVTAGHPRIPGLRGFGILCR